MTELQTLVVTAYEAEEKAYEAIVTLKERDIALMQEKISEIRERTIEEEEDVSEAFEAACETWCDIAEDWDEADVSVPTKELQKLIAGAFKAEAKAYETIVAMRELEVAAARKGISNSQERASGAKENLSEAREYALAAKNKADKCSDEYLKYGTFFGKPPGEGYPPEFHIHYYAWGAAWKAWQEVADVWKERVDGTPLIEVQKLVVAAYEAEAKAHEASLALKERDLALAQKEASEVREQRTLDAGEDASAAFKAVCGAWREVAEEWDEADCNAAVTELQKLGAAACEAEVKAHETTVTMREVDVAAARKEASNAQERGSAARENVSEAREYALAAKTKASHSLSEHLEYSSFLGRKPRDHYPPEFHAHYYAWEAAWNAWAAVKKAAQQGIK